MAMEWQGKQLQAAAAAYLTSGVPAWAQKSEAIAPIPAGWRSDDCKLS